MSSTMSLKEPFVCKECNKKYQQACNLRRHVRLCHEEKYDIIMNGVDKKSKLAFKCKLCPRAYGKASNLRFHERKVHLFGVPKKPSFRCPLCTFVGDSLFGNFESHLKSDHNIDLVKSRHEFDSEDIFLSWKEELERESKSRFVKYTGKPSNQTYKCYRSGSFHSKGKGLRSLKSSGSYKIDGFCPASLRTKLLEGGKITVLFVETHVGHDNDLCGIKLYPKEKAEIAAKIAAKMSFDDILEELRNKPIEDRPAVTRKDLYNIMSCFKLSAKDSASEASVDTWVNKLAASNEWIVVYKPEGATVEQFPSVKSEDFLLIVMSEEQKSSLAAYGSNLICLETVMPLAKGNQLTILLIIDNAGQPYPCAFLVCNRMDLDILEIFFNTMKIQVGSLRPYLLLSDRLDEFFSAWCSVMERPQFHLWSPWLVDQHWRKEIQLIPISGKQIETYKILRALLEENDSVAFNIMLEQASALFISNKDTAEFGKHFVKTYGKYARKWAQCYRQQAGLGGEMYLERIHQTIRHIYLNKNNPKRPDKIICDVMKFMKERVSGRAVGSENSTSNDSLVAELKTINATHEAAASAFQPHAIIRMSPTLWIVPCHESDRMYRVIEMKASCFCKYICEECHVCVHRFWCNCTESVSKWNICRHIHSIGLLLIMDKVILTAEENETTETITNAREIQSTCESHFIQVPTSSPPNNPEIDANNDDSIPDSASLLLGLSRAETFSATYRSDDDLVLDAATKLNLSDRFNLLIDSVTKNEHISVLERLLSEAEHTIVESSSAVNSICNISGEGLNIL